MLSNSLTEHVAVTAKSLLWSNICYLRSCLWRMLVCLLVFWPGSEQWREDSSAGCSGNLADDAQNLEGIQRFTPPPQPPPPPIIPVARTFLSFLSLFSITKVKAAKWDLMLDTNKISVQRSEMTGFIRSESKKRSGSSYKIYTQD